ncbi:Aste57867_24969 [Aphanomyces stellatus]|uniref:Aste57867_24969 protein n=1 Tax=Aphanomyces stellatus TaxID=120398 RepID=A0A485LRW5_9STRA|nr:hypothetical protein As57867_024891 [Aphanomyces stellatus]VFU01600.1 Aste57867_24969 [Aphanomyces stellatus]
MDSYLPKHHGKPRGDSMRAPQHIKLIALARTIYALSIALLFLLFVVFASKESRVPPPSATTLRRLLEGRRILVAANYFNNSAILDAHTHEMARFLAMLQSAGAVPYVSIYENGSGDDTPARLRQWGVRLDSMHVPHTINLESSPAWHKAYLQFKDDNPNDVESATRFRIRFMADVRNKALAPLETHAFDDIVFFNDVLFDAADIARLLVTDNLDYDVVCAMDFNRVTLYDTWVARDVNGEAMSSLYPFTADLESIALLRQGKPFPVSSCWNGVVAMKAQPFVQDKVRFRAWRHDEPRMLSRRTPILDAVYSDDCPGSECGLIFEDLNRLLYTNVLMHPTVHVTYRHEDRLLHAVFGGVLNLLSWALLSIQPHARVPAAARLAQCGIDRPLALATWVYLVVPLVVVVSLWHVVRHVRTRRPSLHTNHTHSPRKPRATSLIDYF